MVCSQKELNCIIHPDEIAFINRVFPTCRNISIDYGIMEKSKNVFVYPSDFGWSDLGTWGSLSDSCYFISRIIIH